MPIRHLFHGCKAPLRFIKRCYTKSKCQGFTFYFLYFFTDSVVYPPADSVAHKRKMSTAPMLQYSTAPLPLPDTLHCLSVMSSYLLGVRRHKSADKMVSVARLCPRRSSQCDHRQFIVPAVHSSDDFHERSRRCWSQERPAADEDLKIGGLRQ